MDTIDRRILSELQDNADLSMQELGDRIGLSHTPCWRRVKRLEERGVVKRRVALLDAEQLDLAVNVFVNVSLRRHQENALNRFETAVQDVPEVVECYSVSGETDFLLRVVVADVTAYERLVKATLPSISACRTATFPSVPISKRRNSRGLTGSVQVVRNVS